eukprot:COSAG01_NODE_338_length_18671_cov_259.238154_12_plen_300_part_00
MAPRLPQDVQSCISAAEAAEARGDSAGALTLYNRGISSAMQQLPTRPDLKPVLESYLKRALALRPADGGVDERPTQGGQGVPTQAAAAEAAPAMDTRGGAGSGGGGGGPRPSNSIFGRRRRTRPGASAPRVSPSSPPPAATAPEEAARRPGRRSPPAGHTPSPHRRRGSGSSVTGTPPGGGRMSPPSSARGTPATASGAGGGRRRSIASCSPQRRRVSSSGGGGGGRGGRGGSIARGSAGVDRGGHQLGRTGRLAQDQDVHEVDEVLQLQHDLRAAENQVPPGRIHPSSPRPVRRRGYM